MVWPSGGSSSGFDAVRLSYQAAATAVNGLFLPAGAAWQIALKDDPSLPLYGGDNFHPAPLGSYLAAVTIYEGLTGRDARNLTEYAFMDGAVLNVPTSTVRKLQVAAHEANTRY
jgi:hypothetical protein